MYFYTPPTTRRSRRPRILTAVHARPDNLVSRLGSDVSIESVEAGCIGARMQHDFRDGTLATVNTVLFWILTSPLLGLQVDETPISADAFAIRTVLVSVTDEDGIALPGLGDGDFQIEEMGVPRDVVEVRGGVGQEIFLLVDTSNGFREGIPSLQKGIEAFAATLREPHEVLLADFGGAVHHLAGPTSDPDVLNRATARMAAGRGAMYLLDAMAHVCSGVAATRQADTESPAVVIVTALTPDASLTPIEEVYRMARESGVFFHVILYDPPHQMTRFEQRAQMENFLPTLAQVSGGGFTKILAAAALPNHLGELGAELMRHRYRVSFLTEVEPRTTLENLSVRVIREGARALPIRLLQHEQVVTPGSTEEPTQ